MGQNISAFRGAYDFLSNFYPAPITYNGLVFKNNEAAFQSAKCPERRAEFCCLNPSEAKRLGRRVKLRNDWDQIKDMVMYEICKAKFRQNPDLAERLISTSDFELIEGNNWGDHIWGVCDGYGENRLGKILMRIRDAAVGNSREAYIHVRQTPDRSKSHNENCRRTRFFC